MDDQVSLMSVLTWQQRYPSFFWLTGPVMPLGQDLQRLASDVALLTGGGLPEAPTDGQTYGRQLANWVPAVVSVAGRTGAVTLTHSDVSDWNTATANFATTASVPGPATVAPVMDGTAAVGVGTTWARADHVHPSDTSRLALTGGIVTGNLGVQQVFTLSRAAFTWSGTVTASGATTINWTNGEYQKVSLTSNASISVTNWPASGNFAKVVLDITNQGAFLISGWPAGTIWAGGIVPTITSGAGKRDLIMLVTGDGGTTVLGNVVGQDYH
jgi:hypothetical protein